MKLYETEYWDVVFVNWSQAFVGNCIISSKMKRKNLGELTKEEWEDLGNIEKALETITKKLFNATMFNFACLMNDAYKNNEEPNVHFHFIPRYKEELILFKRKYKDKHFGYNFWKWSLNRFKSQENIYTKEEIKNIYNMMLKEMKKENK